MAIILRVTILFLISNLLLSQTRIILDESSNDWTNVPSAWNATGAGTGASLKNFKVTNDDEFLFVYFSSDIVYSLQNDFALKLYMDTDNSPLTGLAVEGIGAEIEFNFGQRRGTAYLSGGQFDISFADLFMVTCPTVDSDWFEVAISRNAVVNNINVFNGSDIKIFLADESTAGGSKTNVVNYSFASGTIDPRPAYSFNKYSLDDLRVVSHNVEFDGFFDNNNKPAFERLYSVINPDIIGFSEIYNHSGEDVANRLEEMLPSPPNKSWNAVNAADNFVATRFTIKNSWWAGGFGNGIFLLDLRPEYNTDALVVVAHPPCCNNDENRQQEIDAIMSFIRESKEPGGELTLSSDAPIIIMGDMNLVGDPQQLTTLLTGDIVNESSYGIDFTPDWNGSSFLDAKPLVTELPMSFTQGVGKNPGSFSKGRLDFIIYTGSVLDLQNSFVFYTNSLQQTVLNEFGLLANDTESASDHFPVVADFKISVDNTQQTVASIKQNDSNGSPLMLGSVGIVTGVITAATEFGSNGPAYLQDATAGISIFGSSLVAGLNIGDNITISSPIGFYNGLTQFIYDNENSSIVVNSSGNVTTPASVSIDQILNQTWNGFEEYEGMLVKIESVTIAEQGVFGSGQDYTISDGLNSMTLRIDNDVNLVGTEIPDGEITVVGVIGQFDNSAPYSGGYQILPRFIDDIQINVKPTIFDIRPNDGNGVPIFLNEIKTASGVVTVLDEFGASGPAFMQDTTGGIAIFGQQFTSVLNVGDSITITSKIAQFLGLTEFIYDAGNSSVTIHKNIIPPAPAVVTISEINNQAWNGTEQYEGTLVKIDDAAILESGEFEGNSNYTLSDATGNIILRIDSDVNLVGQNIPGGHVSITAIVGQFDSSSPHSEGYQLQPRFKSDIVETQIINKNIVINSPVSGAVYEVGESIPITWHSENVNSVNVFYRLPNSSNKILIAENINAAQSTFTDWMAPADIDSAIIVIQDTEDETTSDESGIIYIQLTLGVNGLLHPEVFTVFNNYPNPFNPGTTITYYSPNNVDVKIEIFNSVGELVQSESFINRGTGYFEYYWDTSSISRRISSGLYFYTITAVDHKSFESHQYVNKMLLLK